MATKGKITRLGDPQNPYSKPKVVITDGSKMKPLVVKKTVVAPVSPAKKSFVRTRNAVIGMTDNLLNSGKAKMAQLRQEQTDAKRQTIDDAVDGKQKPRK